jgi:hypothetical protein
MNGWKIRNEMKQLDVRLNEMEQLDVRLNEMEQGCVI